MRGLDRARGEAAPTYINSRAAVKTTPAARRRLRGDPGLLSDDPPPSTSHEPPAGRRPITPDRWSNQLRRKDISAAYFRTHSSDARLEFQGNIGRLDRMGQRPRRDIIEPEVGKLRQAIERDISAGLKRDMALKFLRRNCA